jgi:hypothetical protein
MIGYCLLVFGIVCLYLRVLVSFSAGEKGSTWKNLLRISQSAKLLYFKMQEFFFVYFFLFIKNCCILHLNS